MKTVAQLIATKTNASVYSIAPTATVLEAIGLMAEKGIGALLVMEGEHLAGIVSERDYARKMVLHGRSSVGTPVSEIMTRDVITVAPRQNIQECMELMTNRHLRHLPVLDDAGRVVGLLSIGDLVKNVIAEQQSLIQQLEQYIRGE
jgi:CBS domain-containing protein